MRDPYIVSGEEMRWIRNHTTSAGVLAVATTAGGTVHSEASGTYAFTGDIATAWSGYLEGKFRTIATGTNVVLTNSTIDGATASPFTHAQAGKREVALLVYAFMDGATAKLGAVVGEAAAHDAAVAPDVSAIHRKLGHWNFELVARHWYRATSATACAYNRTAVAYAAIPLRAS